MFLMSFETTYTHGHTCPLKSFTKKRRVMARDPNTRVSAVLLIFILKLYLKFNPILVISEQVWLVFS